MTKPVYIYAGGAYKIPKKVIVTLVDISDVVGMSVRTLSAKMVPVRERHETPPYIFTDEDLKRKIVHRPKKEAKPKVPKYIAAEDQRAALIDKAIRLPMNRIAEAF